VEHCIDVDVLAFLCVGVVDSLVAIPEFAYDVYICVGVAKVTRILDDPDRREPMALNHFRELVFDICRWVRLELLVGLPTCVSLKVGQPYKCDVPAYRNSCNHDNVLFPGHCVWILVGQCDEAQVRTDKYDVQIVEAEMEGRPTPSTAHARPVHEVRIQRSAGNRTNAGVILRGGR